MEENRTEQKDIPEWLKKRMAFTMHITDNEIKIENNKDKKETH